MSVGWVVGSARCSVVGWGVGVDVGGLLSSTHYTGTCSTSHQLARPLRITVNPMLSSMLSPLFSRLLSPQFPHCSTQLTSTPHLSQELHSALIPLLSPWVHPLVSPLLRLLLYPRLWTPLSALAAPAAHPFNYWIEHNLKLSIIDFKFYFIISFLSSQWVRCGLSVKGRMYTLLKRGLHSVCLAEEGVVHSAVDWVMRKWWTALLFGYFTSYTIYYDRSKISFRNSLQAKDNKY